MIFHLLCALCDSKNQNNPKYVDPKKLPCEEVPRKPSKPAIWHYDSPTRGKKNMTVQPEAKQTKSHAIQGNVLHYIWMIYVISMFAVHEG